MSTKPQVKRTYGSRIQRVHPLSSTSCFNTVSWPSKLPEATAAKRKRSLADLPSTSTTAPLKKKPALRKLATKFTQLHFSLENSVLRTCSVCELSYTCGAPGDESLHRAHCARVQRGMEWGREEEKERARGIIDVIAEDVPLIDGSRGRIVRVDISATGKAVQKVSTFLETVNLALSAPPLTSEALQASRAYVFLVPSSTNTREKIVGCAVAQRISTAMDVAASPLMVDLTSEGHLVHVDGSLYCKPKRLPTPLGIPRLFVTSSHRRKGIAQALLDAAAKTFVHGCELEPSKGDVAFSQPTSLGRFVMEKWGKGGVRVFEE